MSDSEGEAVLREIELEEARKASNRVAPAPAPDASSHGQAQAQGLGSTRAPLGVLDQTGAMAVAPATVASLQTQNVHLGLGSPVVSSELAFAGYGAAAAPAAAVPLHEADAQRAVDNAMVHAVVLAEGGAGTAAQPPAVRPHDLPDSGASTGMAPPSLIEQSVASPPTREALLGAMRVLLRGKSLPDLNRITLKMLRNQVVGHLALSAGVKRTLQESRRNEFGELASQAVQESMASLAQPVPEQPQWQKDLEDEETPTSVYLITFASVLGATAEAAELPLRTLEGVAREEIRDEVLDAVRKPEQLRRGGRPQNAKDLAYVMKLIVFKEEPLHFHVALKLSKRVIFMAYKAALRRRFGLASHWSCTHREFFSVARYGHNVTEHKPEVDPEPLTWTQWGAPLDVHAESQEPYTATAIRKRREHCEAGVAQTAKKVAKKDSVAFTKLDFYALVETEKLATPAAVLEYSKTKGSGGMRAFVVKNQRRVQELLGEAQDWIHAEEVAASERLSDWALVEKVSKQTCKCPGGLCQWWEAADEFFIRNRDTIDRTALAASIAAIIKNGPGKNARVPLLLGCTNSGKSTVFNPFIKLFGFKKVVHRPGEKASMALANVSKPCKRFIYWDEYRPVEYAAKGTVPVGTFLSLFSGGALEVTVSQSFQNGNAELVWKHGAVMTAKEEGLWEPVPALPGFTPVTREDIKHMQSRVRQFPARVPVSEGAMTDTPMCKESLCRWLLLESARYAYSVVEQPLRQLRGRAMPACPHEQPRSGDGEAGQEVAVDFF